MGIKLRGQWLTGERRNQTVSVARQELIILKAFYFVSEVPTSNKRLIGVSSADFSSLPGFGHEVVSCQPRIIIMPCILGRRKLS